MHVKNIQGFVYYFIIFLCIYLSWRYLFVLDLLVFFGIFCVALYLFNMFHCFPDYTTKTIVNTNATITERSSYKMPSSKYGFIGIIFACILPVIGLVLCFRKFIRQKNLQLYMCFVSKYLFVKKSIGCVSTFHIFIKCDQWLKSFI